MFEKKIFMKTFSFFHVLFFGALDFFGPTIVLTEEKNSFPKCFDQNCILSIENLRILLAYRGFKSLCRFYISLKLIFPRESKKKETNICRDLRN